MRNRIVRIFLMVLATGLPFMTASANQYREVSLSTKVANSDVVVIGQVVSTSTSDCLNLFSCATVKINTRLKGSEVSTVKVLFHGPIAEEDPICCKVGATYVFFLKHARGGYYVSVNGPYGIYQTN
jgi:hypothetical protein